MFLNETKPPLDEALTHFGIKGMRWGVRRERSSGDSGGSSEYHDTSLDYYDEEQHNRTKRKIATGALLVVGAAATVAILHKSGHLKVAKEAYDDLKNNTPKHTFRPRDVRNPLFTVAPKVTEGAVDAGFGKNGVFNVTTMTRGATRIKDFDSGVWSTPVTALAVRRS